MDIKEYQKKQEYKRIKEYQKQNRKYYLMTTRFNNWTENENREFREKKNHTGCFYNTPTMITNRIPKETNLLVLEMNNETNSIVGVGFIVNKPIYKYYKVYSNSDYNINTYIGKYRIDRKEMIPEEEFIMKIFDKLCFQGKFHMKRGQGITAFPMKIIYRCRKIIDLVKSVENMFKRRIHPSTKPIE
jgi:hypothetical protein